MVDHLHLALFQVVNGGGRRQVVVTLAAQPAEHFQQVIGLDQVAAVVLAGVATPGNASSSLAWAGAVSGAGAVAAVIWFPFPSRGRPPAPCSTGPWRPAPAAARPGAGQSGLAPGWAPGSARRRRSGTTARAAATGGRSSPGVSSARAAGPGGWAGNPARIRPPG